jgi:hypothetical protein
MSKKDKGQFYTVNADYILKDLHKDLNFTPSSKIIEPFAGNGDLIDWIKKQNLSNDIEAYDIDPKQSYILKRDTLKNPPSYKQSFVITNPPFLARNKCKDKSIYDKYNTNDLYKCFLLSIIEECIGGILILPVGFFLSPRDIDVYCRNLFLSHFHILHVRYFEESVFPDTSTSVVAFSFQRSNELLTEQNILWTRLPINDSKYFTLSKQHKWIIGGDIYDLKKNNNIQIKRFVDGNQLDKSFTHTSLTLRALDSGIGNKSRIELMYKPNYIYHGKDTSRTFATLCINRQIPESQQEEIARRFNCLIESKRTETWSLFLPQFRESKEYARKRIPFHLAYSIIQSLL